MLPGKEVHTSKVGRSPGMRSESTALREMAPEVHVSMEILEYYFSIRLHRSRTERTVHPGVRGGDQTVVQKTVEIRFRKPITLFGYAADLCLIAKKVSELNSNELATLKFL
jgi:hypothetical protein